MVSSSNRQVERERAAGEEKVCSGDVDRRGIPEEMARLDRNDSNPQWQILTVEDLRREAWKGHQSLKEKYGK